jgi:hypothetical protein
MKIFLETLINRYFPSLVFKIITFKGKQYLEKSIPNFLKSWRVPDSDFIIIHDQDS